MAYLAVNQNGKEIFLKRKEKPTRFNGEWVQIDKKIYKIEGKEICMGYFGKTIPKGTIIATTGKKLTWNDEPIKI